MKEHNNKEMGTGPEPYCRYVIHQWMEAMIARLQDGRVSEYSRTITLTNDYRQDGRVSEYRRTITLTSAKTGPGQQEVMTSL